MGSLFAKQIRKISREWPERSENLQQVLHQVVRQHLLVGERVDRLKTLVADQVNRRVVRAVAAGAVLTCSPPRVPK
jgi:hypothetical protein